jgi:hypothetical protein
MTDRAMQRVEALIAIAETACDNAAKQYDDYYKTFTALDGKAQSTATVGGIVIAAVVAFVNAGKLDGLVGNRSGSGYLLIFSPAAAALAAVVISFFASKVVEVILPFAADDQAEEVGDLADLPAEELSKEHVLSYHRARLQHWKEVLDNIHSAVDQKAGWVWCGQIVLVFSLCCLLLLLAAMVNQLVPAPSSALPVDPF